jgi:hypothetical protein
MSLKFLKNLFKDSVQKVVSAVTNDSNKEENVEDILIPSEGEDEFVVLFEDEFGLMLVNKNEENGFIPLEEEPTDLLKKEEKECFSEEERSSFPEEKTKKELAFIASEKTPKNLDEKDNILEKAVSNYNAVYITYSLVSDRYAAAVFQKLHVKQNLPTDAYKEYALMLASTTAKINSHNEYNNLIHILIFTYGKSSSLENFTKLDLEKLDYAYSTFIEATQKDVDASSLLNEVQSDNIYGLTCITSDARMEVYTSYMNYFSALDAHNKSVAE